jgi:hypothetical protein
LWGQPSRPNPMWYSVNLISEFSIAHCPHARLIDLRPFSLHALRALSDSWSRHWHPWNQIDVSTPQSDSNFTVNAFEPITRTRLGHWRQHAEFLLRQLFTFGIDTFICKQVLKSCLASDNPCECFIPWLTKVLPLKWN